MTSQPSESSLHNPSAWKDVKAFDCIGPFHNLQTDVVAASQRKDPLDQFPRISPVGPDEPGCADRYCVSNGGGFSLRHDPECWLHERLQQ